MSTAHDHYGAYTDAELCDLWNRSGGLTLTDSYLEAELNTRGYATRGTDGERLTLTETDHAAPPAGEPEPEPEPDRYTVELSLEPDEDGDYRARIALPDGSHGKTFYRKAREDARAAAVAWVEYHRRPKSSDEVFTV